MKKKQHNTQPQNVHKSPETAATTGGMAEDTSAVASAMENNNVTALPITKGGKRKSLAAEYKASLQSNVADKLRLTGEVKQRLAEACDTFKQGASEVEHAREIAGNAIVRLYQGQADNLVTKDEVSTMLGETFGFKPKKDGSPGKTPMGEGEAIRKRIVRLHAATLFVNGGDGGAFFAGLAGATDKDGNEAEDLIAAIVANVNSGETSPWAAYDQLAAVKRDCSVRLDLAFDPARIAKLAEALAEPGAVDKYRNNPALVAAYAALNDVWAIVDEAAATANANDEEGEEVA